MNTGSSPSVKIWQPCKENYKREQIKQVIANIVRTFDSQNNNLDKYDPWAGTIQATDFVVQCAYYTTLQDKFCLDMASYEAYRSFLTGKLLGDTRKN